MIEYLKANARDLIIVAFVGAVVLKLCLEIVGLDFNSGK